MKRFFAFATSCVMAASLFTAPAFADEESALRTKAALESETSDETAVSAIEDAEQDTIVIDTEDGDSQGEDSQDGDISEDGDSQDEDISENNEDEDSQGEISVAITGSGYRRTVTVYNAYPETESMEVVYGSVDNVNEDQVMYAMEKQDDGTWTAEVTNATLAISIERQAEAIIYADGEWLITSEPTVVEYSEMRPEAVITGSGKTRTVTLPSDYASYEDISMTVTSSKKYQTEKGTMTTSDPTTAITYSMEKQLDGSWIGVIDNTKLTNFGLVYVDIAAGNIGITSTTYTATAAEIAPTKPSISGSGTTRTITLSAAYAKYTNNGSTKLKAGVWSDENGQDDIRWYTLKKQSDGTYKATLKMSNIYNEGKAYAHIYAGDTYIASRSFTVKASDMTEKSIKVTGTGTTRTITVTGAGGLRNLKAAVWTKTNGQDDLTWYPMTRNSNGTWTVKCNTLALKHKGTTYAKVYADSGYVNGCNFTVKASEVSERTIKVTGTGTTRTITVTGASDLKKLKVAVWSKTKGQDDLKWITMTKNSKGNWTAKYKVSNLKSKGTVYAHAYAGNEFVVGCSFTVK